MEPYTNSNGDQWDSLLTQARAGDTVALGEVCERLRDYLLLVAQHGVGDDLRAKVGASDIVQQSMLEAHSQFEQFSGGSERELRARLEQILRHNLIDSARRYRETHCRDLGREIPLGQQAANALRSDQETPSFCARRSETNERLAQAVLRLPARKRRLIEMRHRDEMTHAEIAEELGMTEAAARKAWSRAVEDLRQMLAEDDQ